MKRRKLNRFNYVRRLQACERWLTALILSPCGQAAVTGAGGDFVGPRSRML